MTALLLLPGLLGCSPSDDTAIAPTPVSAGGGGAGGVGGASSGGGGAGGQAGTLSVRAVAAHQAVGLEWDEYAGAESYNLYWSLEPGVTTADAALAGVRPGYVHRGLQDGTTYHYTVTALDAGGEHSAYGETSATPDGDFVLQHLGTGVVPDVATGGAFAIDIEQRVHAVLLPEGYLDTDLDAGTFDADVAEWHDEIFAISPYEAYEEAFVVWSLPTASAERISPTDPQQADTALRVPITSDGAGVADVPSVGPTADRIWAALDGFPYAPTDFYPAGGRTSHQALNVVVHVLVLDPASEHGGLSGRSRRLDNPNDANETLTVAFALHLAHEFTHAFARLGDEYLDQSQNDNAEQNEAAVDSAHLSNVVTDPDCATLPWRHLLVGTPLNPSTEGLVGAFGTAELGYHAELKCLMNGTHDNAVFYGGDGDLRSRDRMCNFCREVTAFRLLERTRRLADPAASLSQWVTAHRGPFFDRFGLAVPDEVPQTNSDGTPLFEACLP